MEYQHGVPAGGVQVKDYPEKLDQLLPYKPYRSGAELADHFILRAIFCNDAFVKNIVVLV
jgi:hypothetical protein